MPFADRILNRDQIKHETGAGNTTVVMNAWYGENVEWPPPRNIHPLMFSMHFENNAYGNILKDATYLLNLAPIGTRDLGTLRMLMLKNPSGRYNKNSTVIYQTDVQFNKSLLPNDIQKQIEPLTHLYRLKNQVSFFKKSHEILLNYSKAKVVITQRIYCALPCVAMGIPVVYINQQVLIGGSQSGTDGLLDLFHTIDKTKLSESQFEHTIRHFDWYNPPPNPNGGKVMRFRATFWNIIRQHPHLNDTAYRFGIVPYAIPDHPAQDTEILHLLFLASELNCSDPKKGRCSLKWYQWRTLESILYHHPYDKVLLHSVHLEQSEFDVLTDVGYQVEVVNHFHDPKHLRYYFKKTFHVDSFKVFKQEDQYLRAIFPTFLSFSGVVCMSKMT